MSAEANFAASGLDSLPHATADGGQAIAADVRAGVRQDLRVGPVLIEPLQDRAIQRVVDACVELSVAVGAGPALAEQQVRLGVEDVLSVEGLEDVAVAVSHVLAALDDEGLVSVADQAKGGEHPRRAEADDDRSIRWRFVARRRFDGRGSVDGDDVRRMKSLDASSLSGG